MNPRLQGVYAPVLTPFHTGNGRPHTELFLHHCRWLTAQGAGLAIFGTNSEAASLSVAERMELTDALIAGGIPASRLMPGTGACALPDAVALTTHALRHGAPGVLVVPPFFFKGVHDDGLFAYYAELIERVGDARLAVYLYHIPQLSHAPITMGLIERLRKRYPHNICGAKDSSGNWDNTQAMLDAFAPDGFSVFPASESLLSRALPLGAAGCISATVNVNPAGVQALYQGWATPEGPALQARADRIRGIFQSTAMIPAMKAVLARASGDAAWRGVRPPLQRLDPGAEAALFDQLAAADLPLDGYPCVQQEAA